MADTTEPTRTREERFQRMDDIYQDAEGDIMNTVNDGDDLTGFTQVERANEEARQKIGKQHTSLGIKRAPQLTGQQAKKKTKNLSALAKINYNTLTGTQFSSSLTEPGMRSPSIKSEPKFNSVVLSDKMKAEILKIDDTRTIATGDTGYRSILATHGATEGVYYYEIKVLPPALPMPYPYVRPHLRVGFATPSCDLDLGVGSDPFGYAFRDKDGTLFNNAEGTSYGASWKEGDIIGCMINLKPSLPEQLKRKKTVQEAGTEEFRTLSISLGSEITFYKNGENLGSAFQNIYEGVYHPAVGLYMHAKCKFNFGPEFSISPKVPNDTKYKPFSILFEEQDPVFTDKSID